ncbi:MAG: G8 domain-containing protein [Chloroflexota bacterium]
MNPRLKYLLFGSLLFLLAAVPLARSLAATGSQSPHAASHAAGHGVGSAHTMHMSNMNILDMGPATHTAIASGNWSDASTWGGNLPTANALIAIPAGVVVTVDSQLSPRFKSITLDGTLRFAHDVNTELWVDTLIGNMGSTLEVGTAVNPIDPNVTARIIFADLGPIDKSVDPNQLSRGAVLAGKTVMFGAVKTHRTTVATFPRAGESTLTLSSPPSGWCVGDEIVITGSQGPTSDEVRTITAVNGATITLNQPLSLDHVPPKADLNLWVANTTRNIRFESENSATVLRRGHIMFSHTHDVNIHNAGFYGLGRTDKREELDDWEYEFPDVPGNDNPAPIVFTPIPGPANNIRGRYALHVHRAGTDANSSPAVFQGSVVVDSPGWGFVNHSSNVDMINNVSYNIQGAGFYTEAGDEIGSMVGNIAIRTVNDYFTLDDAGAIDPDLGLHRGDFGNDGDGFWLSGTRVSVIDNVASGASAHGIIFWTDGLIEPDTGRATVKVSDLPNGHLIPTRTTVPVWWAPLAEVRNNETSNATVGFRSRYIHSILYLGEEAGSPFHQAPPQAYLDTLNPVIDGITVWGSRDGVLLNYNERLNLRNVRAIGVGAPFVHNLGHTAALGVGVDFNNEVTNGPGSIENLTIEGYEMGFLMPRHGEWRVNNLLLKNVTDMMFHEMIAEPRTMPMTNVVFGSLDGTAVSGRESARRNIVLDMYFDNFSHDPNFLVYPDTITLDGREIYFDQQRADFIPYGDEFDTEIIDFSPIPFNRDYLGKTNQYLMDNYNVSFGGELLPADAVNDTRIINGQISPNVSVTPEPTNTPVPTETPDPTETPAPTGTPDPTGTAIPTETPQPTTTPDPTGTPQPTNTPMPTTTPVPTTTPPPTQTPSDNPQLDYGAVWDVENSSWTRVELSRSYRSMVVVASAHYFEESVPLAVRVRNAAGNSFEVMVARLDGSNEPIDFPVDVYYLVVEEGVYTSASHGITMEAVTYLSTHTDHKGNWVGEPRAYQNKYAQPVVVGQVMSANDTAPSLFWARGSSARKAPSSSHLHVGKHVGEDSTLRANETVGYVVFEAGTASVDGMHVGAALGADIVRGIPNGAPYSYMLGSDVEILGAVVSSAAIDGNDGGWPILYGEVPFENGLQLAINEDQYRDSERKHTTEQVAYVVFTDEAVTNLVSSPSGDNLYLPIVTTAVTTANAPQTAVPFVSLSLLTVSGFLWQRKE